MTTGLQSDIIDYTAYPFSASMLYNIEDLTWFMWNFGSAFFIPLFFLISYHTLRFTYVILKDSAINLDLIGWLYVYSF
jgi:hypothetical protein